MKKNLNDLLEQLTKNLNNEIHTLAVAEEGISEEISELNALKEELNSNNEAAKFLKKMAKTVSISGYKNCLLDISSIKLKIKKKELIITNLKSLIKEKEDCIKSLRNTIEKIKKNEIKGKVVQFKRKKNG